jgi:hypothetical protein
MGDCPDCRSLSNTGGDTIPCPCLIGNVIEDSGNKSCQGQGIMSPKVIDGQVIAALPHSSTKKSEHAPNLNRFGPCPH